MIYSIHFTMWPKWTGTGEIDQRMLLVLGLQTLWSLRLTTNTYRRGFFNPCVLLPFQRVERKSMCEQIFRGLPLGDRSRSYPRVAVQAQCVPLSSPNPTRTNVQERAQ